MVGKHCKSCDRAARAARARHGAPFATPIRGYPVRLPPGHHLYSAAQPRSLAMPVSRAFRLAGLCLFAVAVVLGCQPTNQFVPPPPPKVTVAQPVAKEVVGGLAARTG